MVGLKTLSHYSLYGARVVVRQLNKVCCVDWSIVNYNSETMAPICLPSVYLMLLTSLHTRDKISQTFPSVFAHWNQSSDKGLGMRLSSVHYVWTVHRCIHTSSSMSYILRYVLTWCAAFSNHVSKRVCSMCPYLSLICFPTSHYHKHTTRTRNTSPPCSYSISHVL